jgi:predicted O-methyltransferase YrrM
MHDIEQLFMSNNQGTKVEQLYGPEHFDSNYYSSLRKYLMGRHFDQGLEIGLAWGMSTQAFLEAQPNSTLITVDMNDHMQKAAKLRAAFGPRWMVEYGDSSTIVSQLGKTFDWIYIDGDHTYEGVTKDLHACWPKLAQDGTMVLDDYGNPCGVKSAVDDFFADIAHTLDRVPNHPNGAVIIRHG